MFRSVEPTYTTRIYMSGPIDAASQVCRKFVKRGLCVTIEPTTFIYTGGEERGFVVGLLNYPRFPSTPSELNGLAINLAEDLIEATHQHSALVVGPATTLWITTRQPVREAAPE